MFLACLFSLSRAVQRGGQSFLGDGRGLESQHCVFLAPGLMSPLDMEDKAPSTHSTLRDPQKCFNVFQNQKKKENFRLKKMFEYTSVVINIIVNNVYGGRDA